MKVVIVEDEAIAARRMKRMLENVGLVVIDIISSNRSLEVFIENEPLPELFFMDIHLSDGIVFELLSKSKLKVPIIFTTAYDQYAIKAFKQNSIDYLLKPIDAAELGQAIQKYKETKQSGVDLVALSALLSQKSEVEYRNRVVVKVGDKLRTIELSEVQYFYSDNKMNHLFTANGRSYPIDFSMEELIKELNPKLFYRINRGSIVSISFIKDVAVHSNSRLKILIDKAPTALIVSREKVKNFKAWLG